MPTSVLTVVLQTAVMAATALKRPTDGLETESAPFASTTRHYRMASFCRKRSLTADPCAIPTKVEPDRMFAFFGGSETQSGQRAIAAPLANMVVELGIGT
jgi:hypothetical protein